MDKLNFTFHYKIPDLKPNEIKNYSKEAIDSKRKRFPYIIHKKGDDFNQVFNFISEESYMQPHLHPDIKMIEKMHLISGSFKLILFNDSGKVNEIFNLDKPGQKIQVPGNVWHTYIMTSKLSIIFETMNGVYDPKTWKKMSDWAPEEDSVEATAYFKKLKYIK